MMETIEPGNGLLLFYGIICVGGALLGAWGAWQDSRKKP